MRFCINCGKQIKDEAVFCPHCGTMVDREDNNVTVTVSDAPPTQGVRTNASAQRPKPAQEQPQPQSFWKKYGSCLTIIIIVFLVFLGIYIYGRIVGPTDVDDSERFLPNRLPAQEQVR